MTIRKFQIYRGDNKNGELVKRLRVKNPVSKSLIGCEAVCYGVNVGFSTVVSVNEEYTGCVFHLKSFKKLRSNGAIGIRVYAVVHAYAYNWPSIISGKPV